MTQLEDIQVAHLVPVQGELKGEEQEAQGILKEIDAMDIETQEDLDFAGDILVEVKGKKKHLENERKKVTGPLNSALTTVRGWFRPAVQYYEKCESRLKTKIATYHREQRERQQAALEAAGEASMCGDAETAREHMQEAQAAQVHKVAGVQIRSVVKWDVTDFSKIPRKFLMLNETAVQQYIMQHGVEVEIPGIKIWQDVGVAAKSKK